MGDNTHIFSLTLCYRYYELKANTQHALERLLIELHPASYLTDSYVSAYVI